jgi:hypothetical protein
MNRTIVAVLNIKRETWVFGLTGSIVVLIGLYIYFLSASIVHVVIRQENAQALKTQQSRIAALEREYIAAQHQLSADVAALDGYVAAENKIFINRTESSLVLGGTNAGR